MYWQYKRVSYTLRVKYYSQEINNSEYYICEAETHKVKCVKNLEIRES
jgi:hypothetical protein